MKGPDTTVDGSYAPSGAAEKESGEAEGAVAGGVGRGGGAAGRNPAASEDAAQGTCLGRSRQSLRLATQREHAAGEGGNGCASGSNSGDRRGARAWYSLDSGLRVPKRLGATNGLMAHLAWEVREHHGHVFVVCDGLEEDGNDDSTDTAVP